MTKPILKSVHPTPGSSSHVAGRLTASREYMLCIGAYPSADQHAASAYTERRQVTWLTFKELAISFSASGSCNATLTQLVLRPAYDHEKRVQASQQHAHHPCRDKGCQVQPASSSSVHRSCVWPQTQSDLSVLVGIKQCQSIMAIVPPHFMSRSCTWGYSPVASSP